jgi:hypothetical protein
MWDRENPGPPAMLELWHFALRHYLHLGFRSKTFWMPRRPMYTQSLWWKEVGRGEIFISPNWAPVQKYKSPCSTQVQCPQSFNRSSCFLYLTVPYASKISSLATVLSSSPAKINSGVLILEYSGCFESIMT